MFYLELHSIRAKKVSEWAIHLTLDICRISLFQSCSYLQSAFSPLAFYTFPFCKPTHTQRIYILHVCSETGELEVC